MLQIQDLVYSHPDKELLLEGINLNISTGAKIALVGNNGAGKSTLLQLIAGILKPTSGLVHRVSPLWYVPQHFGQYNAYSVAEGLEVASKLTALHAIVSGDVSEEAFEALADDWTIEERCAEALSRWGLRGVALSSELSQLSGGQKTRLFLAGIDIHRPQLVLLDEPTNHMDEAGRKQLYHYVQTTGATLIVVSHDRSLLNLMPAVYELDRKGISVYGGNYDFYAAKKAAEANSLNQEVSAKQATLRKAQETARETIAQGQNSDTRRPRKRVMAGVTTFRLN